MADKGPSVEPREHLFRVGRIEWNDPFEWLRADAGAQRLLLSREAAYTRPALSGVAATARLLMPPPPPREIPDLGPAERVGNRWFLAVLRPGARNPELVAVDGDASPTTEDIRTGRVPFRSVVNLDAALANRRSTVGRLDIDPTGNTVLWTEDPDGSERHVIHAVDVNSGSELLRVEGVAEHTEFCPAGCHLYVLALDDLQRAHRLDRYDLRGRGVEEVLIEPDQGRRLRLNTTRSRQFVLVESSSRSSSRWWAISDHDAPQLLDWLAEDAKVALEHAESARGHWWIAHIQGPDHPNGEVRAHQFDDPASPVVLIPHHPDRVVTPPIVTKRWVIAGEQETTATLSLVDLDATPPRLTPLATSAEPLSLGASPAWDADRITLILPSYTRPPTPIDLPLARPVDGPIPLTGGDADGYVTERRTVATDGVEVPLTIVRRVDTTTPAPLLLTAYGAYGTSSPPQFDPQLLHLIDAGMVFACAHVRGGGEKGRPWHDGGRGLNKPNSLSDLIACLDALESDGIALPGRVGLIGGSAGGTLMAAAMNHAPERFRAALLESAYVDVLASMINPDLPLTISDRNEWGDPLADPVILEMLRGLSPYENLHDGTYPPILMTVRTNDMRVPPVQALKYAQRFRQVASGGPVLLQVESGGHAAGPLGPEFFRYHATRYAWLAAQLNLRIVPPSSPAPPDTP